MNLCGSGGDAAAGVAVVGWRGDNTRPRFLDANDKTIAKLARGRCRNDVGMRGRGCASQLIQSVAVNP